MVEENFSEDGEQWLVFHVFTAGGKPPAVKKGVFSFVFHSVLRGFWSSSAAALLFGWAKWP